MARPLRLRKTHRQPEQVRRVGGPGDPVDRRLAFTVRIAPGAILENRHNQVIAIEVKAASTVRSDDFNGLRRLAEDGAGLGPDIAPLGV
jgi:hypothetical protein